MFSLVCLVVFARLGFWQWERADAKEIMLAADEIQRQAPPISLHQVPADPRSADGVRVRLTGSYLGDVFLLDNRVLDGKVGFEVLRPFLDDSDQVVIVNRGFVAMGRTRADPPEIPALNEQVAAMGTIHVEAESFGTAAANIEEIGDAKVIQVFDTDKIAAALGEEIYPHVLRLSAEDSNALPRFWPVTVMLPERHRGYAYQWWLMAIAVSVAWGVFTFRRTDSSDAGDGNEGEIDGK